MIQIPLILLQKNVPSQVVLAFYYQRCGLHPTSPALLAMKVQRQRQENNSKIFDMKKNKFVRHFALGIAAVALIGAADLGFGERFNDFQCDPGWENGWFDAGYSTTDSWFTAHTYAMYDDYTTSRYLYATTTKTDYFNYSWQTSESAWSWTTYRLTQGTDTVDNLYTMQSEVAEMVGGNPVGRCYARVRHLD